MKLTKKLLSIAIAVVMVLTMGTIAFARTAADVLDGTETITWTLKAQVMEGTGVGESVALNTESATSNNSSVTSSKVKAQRADVATYKSERENLDYYEAGNTDPIIVNPGDMIWITTHVATSESCYPTTLTQDWFYDSTFFYGVAMSAAQMTYAYEDSELMARADFGISGGSWTRLTINNRNNYLSQASLTDAQKETYHLYHVVTQMDPDIMNDEYGGETVPVDEDVYALPIYVSPDAQPGQVGTICMVETPVLLCEDSEGDYLDTCFTIPASGHIVDNQVLTFKIAGGAEEPTLDFTELDAQIGDYEGRDSALYTDDSWADATTAYNAAVAAKSATEQDAIDTAAANLKNALAALDLKPVLDYTKIDNAIASVPADLSAFTTSTASAVTSAKAAATSAKASATTQAELDNAATALNNAVAALEAKANFANLDAALSEAIAIENEGYTADSWAELEAAIAAGQAFNRDETGASKQASVNAAANAIFDAIDGLKKEVVLDYTAWSRAVANIPASTDGYTPASVAAYASAKDAAYVAYDAAVAAKDQAALDAAAADLEAAIAMLKAVANKAALQAAIADAPEYAADMYANWAAYEAALNAAKDVNADANADQATVDAAKTALVNAKAALVIAGADYAAVEAAKAKVPSDLSGYTEESAKAVADAVDAVEYGKLKTEQALVDAMAQAIEDAVAALEALADYSKVYEAIAAAKAVNADLYVSMADVDAAVAAVEYGLGETKQAEVDAMADAINNAIAALVEKDADYSAVDAAKAKAAAINRDLYTEATLAKVDEAVAAVVEGKKISAQAEVDAMAAAILEAIDNLKTKPTNGYAQEVEFTDAACSSNTFKIKVSGRANKVRFVDTNNTDLTVTYSREAARANGSIVSYNAAGEIVNDLSREIAYEIWTINVSFQPSTYYVNVKDNDGWEDLSLSYIVDYKYSTDDKEIKGLEFVGSYSVPAGEFVTLKVQTGADVVKVQTECSNGATLTFGNPVIEDGVATFTVRAKAYFVGDNVITLNIKTADGWEKATTFTIVGE